MLYGQLSTGFSIDNFKSLSAFDGLSALVGLHYPLVPGVLLTPSIGYGRSEDYSVLFLGAGVQLVLGKNNRPEERAVGSFQRGDLLAGAQGVNLNFTESTTSYGTDLGAYYFLTERFALGVAMGLSRSGQRYISSAGDEKNVYYDLSAGIGTRYYLTTEQHTIWFVEAGASYDYDNVRSTISGSADRNAVQLLGGAGAQIFVRDNVALELGPQLRYNIVGQEYLPTVSVGMIFGIRFLL